MRAQENRLNHPAFFTWLKNDSKYQLGVCLGQNSFFLLLPVQTTRARSAARSRCAPSAPLLPACSSSTDLGSRSQIPNPGAPSLQFWAGERSEWPWPWWLRASSLAACCLCCKPHVAVLVHESPVMLLVPKPRGMLRATGFCQALTCTQRVSVPRGPAPKGAFGLALLGIPIPRVGVPGGKGLTVPDLLRSPPGTLLGLSPAPRCTPQGLTPLGLFKHLQLR